MTGRISSSTESIPRTIRDLISRLVLFGPSLAPEAKSNNRRSFEAFRGTATSRRWVCPSYRLVLLKSEETCGRSRSHRDRPQRVDGSIVHLSHNFVAPEWRRTGLAGWLRALPIQSAGFALPNRGVRRRANYPGRRNEALDRNDPASYGRLKAYEKAGYLMMDPRRIPYLQPDFRAPDEIDLTVVRNLFR